jgi:hypothetical protein
MERFHRLTYDESFGNMFATSEVLHATIAFPWVLNKIGMEIQSRSTLREKTHIFQILISQQWGRFGA